MARLNRLLSGAALAAGILGTAPASAVDVGVSIAISQPGVYGRVDIGRYPQPAVWMPQPVIIARPVVVRPQPVYLWVPPGHRKHWGKHCGAYRACGVPVYFVRDDWYGSHVMADRRGRGDDDRSRGHGKGHGKGRGHDD